jgi:MobA/MobL family
MALYRYSVGDRVSRGKGQSSLRSAAYLARACYEDQRTGWVHDFTQKSPIMEASDHIVRAGHHAALSSQEVLLSGLYAPADAPEWCVGAVNVERFWNAAEAAERRSDAQVAERIIIGLPHELTLEQAVWALQDHVREFTRQGRVVQVAIHSADREHDGRNLHAHLLVSLRGVDANGMKPAKAAEQQERFLNRSAYVEHLRENWAHVVNRHLARHGHEGQLDHRSYRRQGLDLEPTLHMGPGDAKRERDGERTAVGDHNRAVAERNAERLAKRERQAIDETVGQRHAPEPEPVESVARPWFAATVEGCHRSQPEPAAARERPEPAQPQIASPAAEPCPAASQRAPGQPSDPRLITNRAELDRLKRDAVLDRGDPQQSIPGFKALLGRRAELLAEISAAYVERQALGQARDDVMRAERAYRETLSKFQVWLSKPRRLLGNRGIVIDDQIEDFQKQKAAAEAKLTAHRETETALDSRLQSVEAAITATRDRVGPTVEAQIQRSRAEFARAAQVRLRQHYEAEHEAGLRPQLAQWKKRPMEEISVPTGPSLHDRYKAEREAAQQARDAAVQEVYARFTAYEQQARSAHDVRVEQEKAAVQSGQARHNAIEILSALRRGNRAEVLMQRDQELYAARQEHPVPHWEGWLKREAERGDRGAARVLEQHRERDRERGMER